MPAEAFPEKRLLPKVPDTPEIAKVLNAISLFDSRTDEVLCTPMLLWLMVELSTTICAPGSPATPALVFPENTERLIMTLLPFATGFFLCTLVSLTVVLIVEKGRLFRSPRPLDGMIAR